ncbi:MAG: UbiA-like polyprenyltransferase [Deltaproteobacteria bacterium]
MGKLRAYGDFIKIEHALFSFPLILSGAFWAAGGVPNVKLLALILIAGFGARAAALGLNRIIDRKIDVRNPRTASREMPSGRMTFGEGAGVVSAGILIYLAAAWLICDLALYLSPIPLLVFTAYPYMKRFTWMCHFGVGLGLALAPVGGWVAATCSLEGILPALLLSLFTLFWVAGFDIIYATLDEEFDSREGVFSMVSRFGRDAALRISGGLHALAFMSLLALYIAEAGGVFAAIFLIATGALLYLEHERSGDVDLAFFKINILVGFGVFLFTLAWLYLP